MRALIYKTGIFIIREYFFESRTKEFIEAHFKIPIQKTIAMKLAFGRHLLMRCDVKSASQMLQI